MEGGEPPATGPTGRPEPRPAGAVEGGCELPATGPASRAPGRRGISGVPGASGVDGPAGAQAPPGQPAATLAARGATVAFGCRADRSARRRRQLSFVEKMPSRTRVFNLNVNWQFNTSSKCDCNLNTAHESHSDESTAASSSQASRSLRKPAPEMGRRAPICLLGVAVCLAALLDLCGGGSAPEGIPVSAALCVDRSPWELCKGTMGSDVKQFGCMPRGAGKPPPAASSLHRRPCRAHVSPQWAHVPLPPPQPL